MNAAPLLRVDNLHVDYYSNYNTEINHALKGVNFSVDKHRCLGIVGESGSGKSVTLLSILGLMQAPPGITCGEISFSLDGKLTKTNNLLDKLHYDTQSKSNSRTQANRLFNKNQKQLDKNFENIRGNQISIIFQNPKLAFNPFFSIGDQICEMVRLHTQFKSAKESRERALFWLEKVGMDDPELRFNNNPHGLSGGLCQRAMIAMALASEPALLVADEPTTGLDAILQNNILNLLNSIKNEYDLAMIIVSHDLRVVEALADEVLIYHSGMIIEQGSRIKIFSNNEEKHPYTRQLIQCTSNEICFTSDKPTQIDNPLSCPYYAHCDESNSHINNQCAHQIPSLSRMTNEHMIRCWKYRD